MRLGVWSERNPRGLCFSLHYELLVQAPEQWMRRVFRFLELPFADAVLRHHTLVSKSGVGGVRLSRVEPRTKQVERELYKDAVASWPNQLMTAVPDALEIARVKALMLRILGYRSDDGTADAEDFYKRLSERYEVQKCIF